jgi:hypothetical protein
MGVGINNRQVEVSAQPTTARDLFASELAESVNLTVALQAAT